MRLRSRRRGAEDDGRGRVEVLLRGGARRFRRRRARPDPRARSARPGRAADPPERPRGWRRCTPPRSYRCRFASRHRRQHRDLAQQNAHRVAQGFRLGRFGRDIRPDRGARGRAPRPARPPRRGRRPSRAPCAARPGPRPRRTVPVLAPITATGLLRSGFPCSGREAQSTAFLSTPGIEELYSGVANSTASARSIASRRAGDGQRAVPDVVVLVVRRDRLQAIEELEPASLLLDEPAGRTQQLVLCESRRRLPLMPSTRIVRPPSPAAGRR